MGHEPMLNRIIITALVFIALYIYLFVTAPPELAENEANGRTLPIELAFDILNKENELVRSLYTKEIVGASKAPRTKFFQLTRARHNREATGAEKEMRVRFDENWDNDDLDAAPLPAQFLRLTSLGLEKTDARLGLYLGSDYPINDANLFTGEQLARFRKVKENKEPIKFYAQDTQLYVGMYADIAIAKACIECHNNHAESPKNDWRLGDVMGATSWTYPHQEVSLEQLFQMIAAFRQSVRGAYTQLVDKVRTFQNPPDIGENWPRGGYYLPSVDEFMGRIASRNSKQTITALFTTLVDDEKAER
uniref:Tll0287-like domain-containing protein n=2 Tax=Candidatus Kentrum sp. UNK TaxID=2126344 RepID=A0A451AA83_9GAMM|nr:MAG: Protein of unknown function (DUF3365) [Candidatus Kentron sp. UNK]